MENFKSNISNKEFAKSEMILAKNIRTSIFEYIKSQQPDFNKSSKLSLSELNRFRQKYLENYLVSEAGELSKLELEVLSSIEKQELITASVISDKKITDSSYGQRLADKVAAFGGSWKFIILFAL